MILLRFAVLSPRTLPDRGAAPPVTYISSSLYELYEAAVTQASLR